MARLRRKLSTHRHRILIIDDDPDLVASTSALLRQEGHEVLTATDPREGITLARSHRPHLLLLDYLMPEMTGADVVREIRRFDGLLQILLVTGYAEQQPGRKLLAELDIQGYHDKGDGPRRLLVLIDAALKHHRAVDRIERNRRSLKAIVEAGPDISRLQPAEELFRISLDRLLSILSSSGDALVATDSSGLFLLGDEQAGVTIRAGTGRFSQVRQIADLPEKVRHLLGQAMQQARPGALTGDMIAVPLQNRDGSRGCILAHTTDFSAESVELCDIYGRLVLQALENIHLYERATHDQLTQLWNRAFGLQRLDEYLKLAHRQKQPLSIVLLDIDRFKSINDTWGHAAGDIALRAVSRTLKGTCRETDVVSRHGGEEFLITLPGTDRSGALLVAEKLRQRLEALAVMFEGDRLPLTASFGVATETPLLPRPRKSADLLHLADTMLYRAKNAGRNRVEVAREEAA